MQNQVISGNINSLWINNIYENIKSIEIMVRMAREGCNSLNEYVQIPFERKELFIVDAQYKNLRQMHTELGLLVTDLSPLLKKEETEKYFNLLDSVEKVIENRKLFIEDIKNSDSMIVSSRTTPFFYETLVFLEGIRRKLIMEMSGLLFIKDEMRRDEISSVIL